MQATARGEGLGVPAKGVTGGGYEGHYFWDTEVYASRRRTRSRTLASPDAAHATGASLAVDGGYTAQ